MSSAVLVAIIVKPFALVAIFTLCLGARHAVIRWWPECG
jgi:hypothetical protein